MDLTRSLVDIPGFQVMIIGLFGIAAAAKSFERAKNGSKQ